MRFSLATTVLALSGAVNAASSWGFKDGSVIVSTKGAQEPTTVKFTGSDKAKNAVTLGSVDTLKVSLTTQEGSKAKRAHQAFLVLKEASGLEAPFPLALKESGKGSVKLTQRDLPAQFLLSESPIQASIVVGSFGTTGASVASAFDINVKRDPNAASPSYKTPVRYGKQKEIHHIFRDDPKNPPKIISLAFAGAVIATVPVLFIAWLALGANLNALGTALSNAPISHALFFGSIVTMEGVFFLYYSSWNLFQTLPVIGFVGLVAFLSGNKALAEVQSRRVAGER